MPVLVLTGVTRGLGRALTDRFVEAEWTVVGCGRSANAIAELRSEYKAPHDFQAVDVADVHAVEDWSTRIVDTYGAPDLLLNNAAIINRNAPLWDVSPEEFSQVIDINIKGVYHVLRSFLPAMTAERRGVIVNYSSGWGRSTSPDVAPYCATKWAMEGLSQALAQELPRGMACVALNPGIIDTAMLRSCFGSGAGHYDDAEAWSHRAAPFLMQLDASDNGRSLTVPGS